MKKKIFKKKIPLRKDQLFSFFISLTLLFLASWLWEALHPIKIPTEEKPVTFYANQDQDDFRRLFIQEIQEAKKNVHLIMYSLKDAGILKALQKKANEGVDVYVVADQDGSSDLHEKLRPPAKVLLRKSPGIMHQKILVIDEKKSFIGSTNMTFSSLRIHGNLVFGFHHVPFAEYLLGKVHTLKDHGRPLPITHQTFGFNEQQGEMWFLPDEKQAVDRIKNLLSTAEKTIQVAMYTWTREDFADEIVKAKQRGVNVTVVIDGSQSQGVCKKMVEYLRERGIKTGVSQCKGLLHHKFVYIDGKTLVNGSTNWTKAAFTKNDDCFMILSPLLEEQKKKMDKIWKVIEQESDLQTKNHFVSS